MSATCFRGLLAGLELRSAFEGAASSPRTEPFGAHKKSSGFRWDMG